MLWFSQFPLFIFSHCFVVVLFCVFFFKLSCLLNLTYIYEKCCHPQNCLDELHSATSSPALSWVRLKCWKPVIKLNHCTMMEMFLASGDSVDIANKCFKLDALSLKPPLTLISIWYLSSSISFFPKYPIQSNMNLCLTSVHFGSGPSLRLPFGKIERQCENSVNFHFFPTPIFVLFFFFLNEAK